MATIAPVQPSTKIKTCMDVVHAAAEYNVNKVRKNAIPIITTAALTLAVATAAKMLCKTYNVDITTEDLITPFANLVKAGIIGTGQLAVSCLTHRVGALASAIFGGSKVVENISKGNYRQALGYATAATALAILPAPGGTLMEKAMATSSILCMPHNITALSALTSGGLEIAAQYIPKDQVNAKSRLRWAALITGIVAVQRMGIVNTVATATGLEPTMVGTAALGSALATQALFDHNSDLAKAFASLTAAVIFLQTPHCMPLLKAGAKLALANQGITATVVGGGGLTIAASMHKKPIIATLISGATVGALALQSPPAAAAAAALLMAKTDPALVQAMSALTATATFLQTPYAMTILDMVAPLALAKPGITATLIGGGGLSLAKVIKQKPIIGHLISAATVATLATQSIPVAATVGTAMLLQANIANLVALAVMGAFVTSQVSPEVIQTSTDLASANPMITAGTIAAAAASYVILNSLHTPADAPAPATAVTATATATAGIAGIAGIAVTAAAVIARQAPARVRVAERGGLAHRAVSWLKGVTKQGAINGLGVGGVALGAIGFLSTTPVAIVTGVALLAGREGIKKWM